MSGTAQDTRSFGVGTMAYIDSIRGGMIPVKVVGFRRWREFGTEHLDVIVKHTTSGPGYTRGELSYEHPNTVVPRAMCRPYRYGWRIRNDYTWDHGLRDPDDPLPAYPDGGTR